MNADREKNILRKLAMATGLLAAVLFLSAWLTEETSEERHNLQTIALRAESNLKALESGALRMADTLLPMQGRDEMMLFFSGNKAGNLGITFLAYENNTLLAWSGSDVTFASIENILGSGQKIMHLPNGWYRILVKEKEKRKIVVFISVFSEYSYQNKFLVNGFNPALKIPSGISFADASSKFTVRSSNGEKLFGIRESAAPAAEEKLPFPEWLETLAIILLLASLLFCGRLLMYRSFAAALMLSAVIVGARITMLALHFPEPLYQTILFSPKHYASSFFFNSPGDLLLNILTLFAVALVFFCHPRVIKLYGSLKPSAGSAWLHFIFLLAFWVVFFAAVQYFASGLIINSKISFNLGNVLELDGFSILGFFILALMMGFCYVIFRFAAQVIEHSFLAGEQKKRYIAFGIILALFAGVRIIFPQVFPEFDIADFIFLIAISLLAEVAFIRKKSIAVSQSVIFLLLFSLYASVLVSEFNSRKKDENLKMLARKLETGRDYIAEHLFGEISPRLKEDRIIMNMLADGRHDLVALRLLQIYFSGYWSKYDIAVAAGADSIPATAARAAEKLISEKGRVSASPELFFIEANTENISYIARLFLSQQRDLYILFSEKLIQLEKGFPELYLSGDASTGRDGENFSFARYSNGSLISSYGTYAYSSRFSFHKPENEFEFSNENLYRHLVYKPNASTFVVVSKPAESELLPFTTFSYIVSFFALLALVAYTIIKWISRQETRHISLRQRVQGSVILVVLVSFALIGWTTVTYVSGRYDKEIDKRISEKITAAHHAMEAELPGQQMLADILSDEKTSQLTRLSSNLSADFNLYDLNGRLIFSSQPRLYQQGIISDRMNPDAFIEMTLKGRTRFIHPESIGRLNYIAAYEPVQNRNHETEGYIGLPYFEKQEELKRELSSFIGSLMNLYVVLLAAALGAAYLISSRITRPLRVLQEKFGATRLGQRNEQIEWQRNDEIGNLVRQYNIMVGELEASAELLARSEREGAWREMAKQVAHEIKNPLTPMKLNIQLLQKAMEENSPQMGELTERVSHLLMEQIDALTSIASSFSSFARMPHGRKEQVNLYEILSSVVNLYNNSPSVQIILQGSRKEYFVLADKEELLRMFGNIVKNAMQSIPQDRHGKIEIKMNERNNHCIVSVSDNGMGIPPELQVRIFTPNFTTKTAGMGLGLAIVKSIAESIDGKVWFETEEGKGTDFFVELPVIA